jgi:2-keto-3-deoxy-L-fuconate dehydrogenase
VSRAALPHLRQSDHAAIVNICSVVAVVGVPNRALYSASKGAVGAVTLALAADHVGEGIRVNAVMPGTADTRGSADYSTTPRIPWPLRSR